MTATAAAERVCEKCGKGFKNGRALHAHSLTCWRGAASVCDCADGGTWELLDATDNAQRHWMQQINPDTNKKYRKVCITCLEVV